MKLIAAAVLAFTAASVLGGPVYSKDTAVYARRLYEREDGEGFLAVPPFPHVRRRSLSTGRLQTFEKRWRKGGADKKASIFKSVSGAAGTMGGSTAPLGILNNMMPPAPPGRSHPKPGSPFHPQSRPKPPGRPASPQAQLPSSSIHPPGPFPYYFY